MFIGLIPRSPQIVDLIAETKPARDRLLLELPHELSPLH
jgi:hypothetical protein